MSTNHETFSHYACFGLDIVSDLCRFCTATEAIERARGNEPARC